MVRESLELSRVTLPNDSPELAGQLATVSMTLLSLKAWDEAEPLIREALTIREKVEPDAWTTFNTKSMLGGALLGQKKYAESEPLLLAGYEGLKQRETTIPEQGKVRLPEALNASCNSIPTGTPPNRTKAMTPKPPSGNRNWTNTTLPWPPKNQRVPSKSNPGIHQDVKMPCYARTGHRVTEWVVAIAPAPNQKLIVARIRRLPRNRDSADRSGKPLSRQRDDGEFT